MESIHNGLTAQVQWMEKTCVLSVSTHPAASFHFCRLLCMCVNVQLWGWSLDLLDVRGQTIERHVFPMISGHWNLRFSISCLRKMTPTHQELNYPRTHFNPLDQVSPNPVLEGPNSARFSIRTEIPFTELWWFFQFFLDRVWLSFWFDLIDDLEWGTVVFVDQKFDFLKLDLLH